MGTDVEVSELIWALRELADENVQRRLWLPQSGSETPKSSAYRAHMRMINKTGVGYELDIDRTMFSSRVDGRLRQIDEMLEEIDETQLIESLIASDKMEAVRFYATEVLELIPHDEVDMSENYEPDFSRFADWELSD